MTGRLGSVLVTVLIALNSSSALAQSSRLRVPVSVDTLPNGLTLIVHEDHSVPTVAINVWFHVGSGDEKPGRTGFAHLFEHMMFQGSANVKKAEHGQYIERAGGQLNGSTQPDRTNYYNEVPSNRLNLALWLEADRMRSLAVNAENLKNQQEAVKEERRLRFDNAPYTAAFVDSLPTLFDRNSCFAYAHSIIGSMDDLNAATVADVKAFFDLYYAPNNAILVIVGDFQPAQARRMVTEYFAGIARGATPSAVTCAPQAATGREVVRRIPDRNANLPAILTAYRAVPPSHADFPALELLSTIIGGGESSRLNRTLVRDAKVAVAAQSLFNPFGPMRGTGIFGALVIANQGVDVDTLRVRFAREMTTIAQGITAEELTKAKNSWRSSTIFGRQTAIATSEAVHYAAMFLGSPEAINSDAARYEAVTLADLRRVAATYLRPDNSLTLVIVPEAK